MITQVAPATTVYIANSSKIGGGNRSFMDLITRLDRRHYRPVLVAPTPGPLVDWASSEDVPHYVVPAADWDGRRGLALRTIHLVRILLRCKARIVHAMAPTCYRAAGVAARLTRTAAVCHLGYPPESGELEWSFKSPPDVVVACHEGQARDVAQTVGAVAPYARLLAVPNGIDVQRFLPPHPADALPRWHPRKRVVMIVGHLSEVKGHPVFFRAAAELTAAGEDCAFVALGGETASVGYRAKLESLVSDLGLSDRVTFLGWRSDVDQVLRVADIVVMPSRAEGLPMAILEAMACARPIVATPVGGIPDAITDGVTGLLVPPDDASVLAGAIAKLLRDPTLAAELGALARRRAVADFSVATAVARVEAIYARLLRQAHATRDEEADTTSSWGSLAS